MIQRRGNIAGITAYLKNKSTLEARAAHRQPRFAAGRRSSTTEGRMRFR
jgi:hypothetical protein